MPRPIAGTLGRCDHSTVPFAEASQVANPDGISKDELPSLLELLIDAWAFKQVHPDFSPVSVVAARFEGSIDPSRLEIADVNGADLVEVTVKRDETIVAEAIQQIWAVNP